MKTLDEVIQALEDLMPCDGSGCSYIEDTDAEDALYYLKAFAAKRKVLEYKEKHYDEIVESMLKEGQEREARCQAEIARYQEAVRNCEAAELKYRKLAQSLGEVGNAGIPQIESDMSEEEAEAIRKEIAKNAELRQKLGAPPVEGM